MTDAARSMVVVSELLVPISFFVLVGFVLWVGLGAWTRNRQLRVVVDFNTRLLDKLGSVKDFSEFVETEAGAALLRGFAADTSATSAPQRILRATQTGVILLCLGVGVLLLGRSQVFAGVEPRQVLAVLGAVALSLGIGCLISAALSYRLAVTLGVLHPPARPTIA